MLYIRRLGDRRVLSEPEWMEKIRGRHFRRGLVAGACVGVLAASAVWAVVVWGLWPS